MAREEAKHAQALQAVQAAGAAEAAAALPLHRSSDAFDLGSSKAGPKDGGDTSKVDVEMGRLSAASHESPKAAAMRDSGSERRNGDMQSAHGAGSLDFDGPATGPSMHAGAPLPRAGAGPAGLNKTKNTNVYDFIF
jgi:hypothetical protein